MRKRLKGKNGSNGVKLGVIGASEAPNHRSYFGSEPREAFFDECLFELGMDDVRLTDEPFQPGCGFVSQWGTKETEEEPFDKVVPVRIPEHPQFTLGPSNPRAEADGDPF